MDEEVLYSGKGVMNQELIITRRELRLGNRRIPTRQIRRGYAINSRLIEVGSIHFKLDLGPFYRFRHGGDLTIAVFPYDRLLGLSADARDEVRRIEAALDSARSTGGPEER